MEEVAEVVYAVSAVGCLGSDRRFVSLKKKQRAGTEQAHYISPASHSLHIFFFFSFFAFHVT